MTAQATLAGTTPTSGRRALALTMALRELRAGAGGLVVFVLCIALGVAAVAAIGSLAAAFDKALANQGRLLIGGDLSFEVIHRQATAEETAALLDLGQISQSASFRAMARSLDGKSALTTASLPIGGSDFTKQLATAFELTDEDAERLKLAYSRGRLDPGVALRVGDALGQLVERWMGELEGALRTLCGVEGLPGQFSLCGGGSVLPGVAEALRSYPWVRRLKRSRHPEVHLIRPEEIRNVLDGTGQLRGQQYACPMAIAGHFGAREARVASWESALWEVKRPNAFVDGGERI